MDSDIKNFLNANKTTLLEIYKKEDKERGEGILHITKNIKENKLDVLYLELKQLPDNLRNDIKHIIFHFIII